jgi:hypothetical protein
MRVILRDAIVYSRALHRHLMMEETFGRFGLMQSIELIDTAFPLQRQCGALVASPWT